MITLDLEQLVLKGTLPPFDHETSRSELIARCGKHDSQHPDIIGYGHIGFDFAGRPNLQGLTIAFPQYYRICFQETEQHFDQNAWPDRRFIWNFGRLEPNFSLGQTMKCFPELTEWKRNHFEIGEHVGCSVIRADHSVELTFLGETNLDSMIIGWIHVVFRAQSYAQL